MTEMIYETIVISQNADGTPHIAPFGVRLRDGLMLIAPFRPSQSLDNLLRHRQATINLTDDVRVFAGALCGHANWPVNPSVKIDGHVLENALSHHELELSHVVEDAQRPELYFNVVHTQMHRPFLGFNRAQAAVIELAVLSSRLGRLPREKVLTEMDYLQIAISKTAGAREQEAWQWLVDKINLYYQTDGLSS